MSWMESWHVWLLDLPSGVAYVIIVLLCGLIYQQVFARSLPLFKRWIVYFVLMVGCGLLLIFHRLGFPMISILCLTVVMIMVTKLRLRYSRSNEKRPSQ
jgi:hypothetical protein